MRRTIAGTLVSVASFAAALAQSTPTIDTLAGTGEFGFSGDGGPAILADLASPWGMAVDADGNLYFGDYPGDVTGESARIRRIDRATGVITTLAGTGTIPSPNDGELAADAAIHPFGIVAVDAAGNVYFDDLDDEGLSLVRRIDATTGIVTTVAGGNPPTAFVTEEMLVLPFADGVPNVHQFSYASLSGIGDGGPATSAYLDWISDLDFDVAGNLFVAEGARVRRIDAESGVITTVAGTGAGRHVYEEGHVGPFGTVSQTDFNGAYSADGVAATGAGLQYFPAIALDGFGDLLIAETGRVQVIRDRASGEIVVFPGQVHFENGSYVDNDSGLAYPRTDYSLDIVGISRVRRVDAATGIIATIAGAGTIPMESGVPAPGYDPYQGDGGPATDATVNGVRGLAVDGAGIVLLADSGNSVIRRIDAATGIISTVAGDGSKKFGGDGGPALLASLNEPNDVVVDSLGNLYIADWYNYRIRRITGLSNAPPTADAGPDQTIHVGLTALLDGSASFDDDTPTANLDYAWTLLVRPDGSAAVLSGASSSNPSLLADVPGTFVVELVVTDEGGLASAPDSIELSSTNLAPTADAGADRGGVVGQAVQLDGSASFDPEMDSLTYFWAIAAVPDGSAAELLGPDTAMPSFVPDLAGIYTLSLVVDDGYAASEVDEVEVTVITGEEFAAQTTVAAMEHVDALPSSSVSTQGNQRTLSQFLALAVQSLQAENVAQARSRLRMALERVDGYALRGALDLRGPSRDWVTEETEQRALYDDLAAALSALD